MRVNTLTLVLPGAFVHEYFLSAEMWLPLHLLFFLLLSHKQYCFYMVFCFQSLSEYKNENNFSQKQPF